MNSEIKEKYSRIAEQTGFSYIMYFTQSVFAVLLLVILTRVLTLEEYGVYSLLAAFAMLAVSFFELGVTQYNIMKLPGQEREKRISIFFSVLVFEAVLVAGIFVLIGHTYIGKFFLALNTLEKYGLEFRTALGIVFFGIIARFFDTYYRAEKKINTANAMEMFRSKGWFLILLVLFLAYSGFTLLHSLLVWLLGTIAVVLIYVFDSRKEIIEFMKIGFRAEKLKEVYIFSLPLVPVITAGWFIISSNRYILNFYESVSAVGIYALVYSLFGMIATLGITVCQTIQPYFAEAWNRKKDYNSLINASLKYSLIIVLPAISGVLFMRKELITLVSGSKYIAGASVVPALIFYPVFAVVGFVFYKSLVAANKVKFVGIVHAGSIGLSFVLNFLLVPLYGMFGAAISAVLSYFAVMMGMYIEGRKYVKINHSFLKLPRIVVASVIAGAVAYLVHPAYALTKIIAILIGIAVYVVVLLALKVFEKKEKDILRGFLPHRIRGIILNTNKSQYPRA